MLLAAVGGCGRERKAVTPVGAYRYGIPRPVDLTPVAVAWASAAPAATVPASPPSPPAGDAPATAPNPAPPSENPTPREKPAPATPPPPRESKGAYRVGEVKGGATIRGFCRIQGDPTRPPVEVFKNNLQGCGAKQQPTERLIVGKGGALANCLVSVRGVKGGKDFPDDMRSEDRIFALDQKGCRYRPHVAVLRTATQVSVKNSDEADHNIHGYLDSYSVTKFNFSSSPGSLNDNTASAFLEDTGAYLVKCDIHPWMSAILHVSTHPYHDVTSAEDAAGKKAGEFVIDGVPAGEYEVTCWHEGMEETPVWSDGKIASYSYSKDVWAAPQKVTLAAGETKNLPDFTIDASAKK